MSMLLQEHVLAIPIGNLSERSSQALFDLKSDAIDLLSKARAINDHLDRATELKFASRAHALRLAAGKDTGIVHFEDGPVQVTADLPKKVEWDQTKLAEITRRIAANGENPAQYVEVSYRVSETKFGAWPETLKSAFVAARTLKTGKPSFRLALVEGVQA